MRKFMLAALVALLIAAGLSAGASAHHKSAKGAVKPSTPFCTNIIVAFPSDHPGPYVPQGTVLTASTDGTACIGTITGYQWRRNGTNISGATSSTYTTQAADAGTDVTVRVTGTNQNATSINAAHVLGSTKLDDEFNGSAGQVDSSTWTVRTGNDAYATYSSSNTGVNGAGYAYVEALYNDQDGDSDSSSASDTDSTSEPGDYGSGDWTIGSFQSNSAMTGARYVEVQVYVPCTDNNTGWTDNSGGWEYSIFQGAGLGAANTDEIDVMGFHSKTDWFQDGGNNGDYVLSSGWATWNHTAANSGSTFDGDSDGDTISSDTDTPVTQGGDADDSPTSDSDGDESSVAESALGRGDNYSGNGTGSVITSPTEVCGTWTNVYGALVQAHSITFYYNGSVQYTIYTSSAYGSPNQGFDSSYELTQTSLKTVYSLISYQSPPENAAWKWMGVNYVQVHALS